MHSKDVLTDARVCEFCQEEGDGETNGPARYNFLVFSFATFCKKLGFLSANRWILPNSFEILSYVKDWFTTELSVFYRKYTSSNTYILVLRLISLYLPVLDIELTLHFSRCLGYWTWTLISGPIWTVRCGPRRFTRLRVAHWWTWTRPSNVAYGRSV